MTREEEIIQAADECYPTWEEHNVGFCQGAKWADKNPRKGLWDSEKVCDFIKNNSIFSAANSPVIVEFDGEELVRKLRKAMED